MTAQTKNAECITLRSARPADLPSVLSLLARSNLPSAGVADALPHFVIADNQGELVGVAGLEVYGDSALLRSVAVDESWRGGGVGRTLIERALSLTRERALRMSSCSPPRPSTTSPALASPV
jgi:amino-acid N-acetyltransferase